MQELVDWVRAVGVYSMEDFFLRWVAALLVDLKFPSHAFATKQRVIFLLLHHFYQEDTATQQLAPAPPVPSHHPSFKFFLKFFIVLGWHRFTPGVWTICFTMCETVDAHIQWKCWTGMVPSTKQNIVYPLGDQYFIKNITPWVRNCRFTSNENALPGAAVSHIIFKNVPPGCQEAHGLGVVQEWWRSEWSVRVLIKMRAKMMVCLQLNVCVHYFVKYSDTQTAVHLRCNACWTHYVAD